MAIWEYKVITSGKGGFATPALLEKFLNDLGKEEWDILHFHAQPDNPLAFTGVARRSTQRDWTLEDAAAAAARSEADKLRAEFEAKFKGAGAAGGDEEKPVTLADEKSAADDGFRRVRDTERDLDPDAPDEEKDEWDMLTSENELPTFFEAIRPHMRRNQRGPGMSVGVEHLAKKWDFSEQDIKTALVECGFVVPDDEDSPPVYIEYEGDLYWLNLNRRGELWLNTKEKARPVFRTVPGQRITPEAAEEPRADAGSRTPDDRPQAADQGQKAEDGGRKSEERASFQPTPRNPHPAKAAEPLPQGPALLGKIRPLMRRNRRGPGGSGSMSFLSRGLKCTEADLMTAFATLGLVLPAAGEKPVEVAVGHESWWLNQDQRGGVWINGQEKAEDGDRKAEDGQPRAEDGGSADGKATADGQGTESPGTERELPMDSAQSSVPAPGNIFAAVRLLLKETKTGAVAGKVDRLAEELDKAPGDFTAALVAAGLVVPEKAREKPVFVEHAGEIFWFNRNAKDELWLNAKVSKFADGEKKPARRGRSPKKNESS